MMLVLVLVCTAVPAADPIVHPLITPYPDSKVGNSKQTQFDAYNLVTGVEENNPVGETFEGRVTRSASSGVDTARAKIKRRSGVQRSDRRRRTRPNPSGRALDRGL